jgi:hypothetical protein
MILEFKMKMAGQSRLPFQDPTSYRSNVVFRYRQPVGAGTSLPQLVALAKYAHTLECINTNPSTHS